MQLDVRLWDLQGAVAGGAAAELETWSLLPAVCPTRWKQLSVLGHCRREAVFVLLGYSWCPPIHTPDSHPRFIPDSYPDSYPSAAICSQEPLVLWAALAKLCRPNLQKTQHSKRSTARTSSRPFSQKFARRWDRQACCDVSSATRHTTGERPTGLCAAAV